MSIFKYIFEFDDDAHFFSSAHPQVMNESASMLADFYAITKWIN